MSYSANNAWDIPPPSWPIDYRLGRARARTLDRSRYCESPFTALSIDAHRSLGYQGFALVGMGASSVFQGLQAYVIDSFPRYAASGRFYIASFHRIKHLPHLLALAAVSCFRSLAGFGFPLFAPYLYSALGYGKGDTILAAFFFGVGCPALILFYIYGERIRSMSKRAAQA